ncbi:hypothetical protein Alg130_10218, partial [Pyrenophora tritici-repentis]
EPGDFNVGLKDLQPGQTYVIMAYGATVVADESGNAQFKAHSNGRTVIPIRKQAKH